MYIVYQFFTKITTIFTKKSQFYESHCTALSPYWQLHGEPDILPFGLWIIICVNFVPQYAKQSLAIEVILLGISTRLKLEHL